MVGERSTHVRTIQGWEERIATMIPFFLMTGKLVSPLVLIFRGKGKRVAPDELAAYAKLKDIVVLWQKKAWIDRYLEKEVLEKQVVRYARETKKAYEDAKKIFPGFLLLQDRGPGHDDEYSSSLACRLNCAHFCFSDVLSVAQKASIEIVLTPSDTTWAIQLVDDGRGKALRSMILEDFDKYLEEFDWESNPRGVLTSKEKRILTAQLAQRAFEHFSTSEAQTQNTINAAMRTGGRMEMEANYDQIQPVRFPTDFGRSILPGHPLSGLVKPYYPVGTITPSAPQLAPSQTGALQTVAVAAGGTIEVPALGYVVTGGPVTLTIPVERGSSIVATATTAEVAANRATVGQVRLEVRPSAAAVASAPGEARRNTSVGRVEMTDGYESDEHPRIFLQEEVDESEEASSSSSSDGDEARIVARGRRRVRGCLAGCDCERQRGRLCNCERAGGFCGDLCSCNKELCRTLGAFSDAED